jgi:hypothetical protein
MIHTSPQGRAFAPCDWRCISLSARTELHPALSIYHKVNIWADSEYLVPVNMVRHVELGQASPPRYYRA